MSFTPPNNIIPFPLWNMFTPTLPNFYWDVDSQEERIKRICLELKKLTEYSDYLASELNLDHEIIKELEQAFQDFIDGNYDEFYKQQIHQWIIDHFPELMKAILNYGVFFGLTDDGYFCANVAWQLTVVFDTIMNYADENYGHLTLTY